MSYFKTIPTSSSSILAVLVIASVGLLGACELGGSFTDPYEPNDSISEAYPIDLGESYTAFISENDADFFEFRTEHGSKTFDELEISVTDVGSDLYIGIVVFDSNREIIHQNTSRTKGANLTSTLRDLQSDGPYYVRFSGTWGNDWVVDGIGDYRNTGRYTFRVRNLNANDAFAGNHSIDDAHPIDTGQTYNGVLVSNLEADYYSFTPSSDNMALVISEAGTDLMIGAALYGPDRQLLGKQQASTGGGLLNINLTNMDTSVTYYLRFSGTWGHDYNVDGTGDYRSRGPYAFSVQDVD